MKIIILISFILCMELFSYSGSCQAQTNSKDFQIHKSKRVFVNKKDRPYIKKQVMEQPVQKKSADDLIASGNQKEELNDYKGAITDFNKALLMEPKSSKILYYCGFIKFQMEDYGNAITDYNRAIESDTESVELYYCRGNAKFQLEYFDDAISDYNKSLRLDSTDSQSYFNRALSKYKSGETKSSCNDLQSAIKYGDKEAEIIWREICQ